MQETYKLNEQENKTLNELLAKQKGVNVAFSKSCQEFARLQTEILIEKDAFWVGIADKMGIDYQKAHAEGKRMKSENGVVTIIDAQPPKPEGVQ